jgi:hypothetical protein
VDIRLHIERLVIDGSLLATGSEQSLESAMQMELLRLLHEDGLAPRLAIGGTLHHLAAPTIRIEPHTDAKSVGETIAKAIYRGIGT